MASTEVAVARTSASTASSSAVVSGVGDDSSRHSKHKASKTCSAHSTKAAPSRIKRWQPADKGLATSDGTAITSRPCSRAMRAVMSEPLLVDASTTTTPRQRPLTIRLRAGKWCLRAGSRGAYSVANAPPAATISVASGSCERG